MRIGAVVGLAVLLGTSSAQAEEPVVGVGLLVAGGASLAVAGVNLAASAACAVGPLASANDLAWRSGCLTRQIGIGVAFAVVSVPLFAVGGARYADESRRSSVALAPLAGGASLVWRGRF